MITRRDVLASGIVATTLAMFGKSARSQPPRSTFLLVHGSWAGGWVWRRVVDLLESRGHKVFAPTLTGVGERSHLLNGKVDLGTHITDIVNVIKWERLTDLVLVGHSYGGNVITGVAEQVERSIKSIVFLDAFVPENGPLKVPDAMLDTIKAAEAKGENRIPPPPIASFRNNEKDSEWIEPLLTPMPIASYTSSLVLTGARERIRKKTFVRATRYRVPAFEAAYAKVRSNSTWITHELDCGHHVMVDMPDRVVEILLEAA